MTSQEELKDRLDIVKQDLIELRTAYMDLRNSISAKGRVKNRKEFDYAARRIIEIKERVLLRNLVNAVPSSDHLN